MLFTRFGGTAAMKQSSASNLKFLALLVAEIYTV